MELRPGYKQTEIGVIPEDWCSSKIGDFAFVTKLAGFEYTIYFDYSKSGPIIAIRALNIKGGTLDLDDIHTIPRETSEALPRSKLNKGDLVMSYVGTLGRVAVIPENNRYHLAPNVAKITVNAEKVSPYFLGHFLNSHQGQKNINNAATLTSQAALSMRNLREIYFVRPPINEQHAIATALSDVDDLITSLDNLIAKKRLIKQGAMQELLTGKTYLPGFNTRSGINKTEAGEIPEDWDVKTIAEIAPLQRGFDLPSSRIENGPFPVVYSNGIMNYHKGSMVRGPGVVTGRSGTLGTVQYIETDYWPHNTTLWVTNFQGNDPLFIYFLYSYVGFERFTSGSGVPTLNRNDAHSYRIAIPSNKHEQKEIATVLSDMDTEIGSLEKRLYKTRLLKQGMMQELLTGRIRLI